MSTSGIEIASISSSASAQPSTDVVVDAVATTAANGIAIGPLTISAVHSRAEAKLTPGGITRLTSSLGVGQIAVNGVEVGFDAKGLTIAGTTVPLPSAGSLAQSLQGAGISFSYLAANETATGVTAPAISITAKETDPNGKAATFTYTLGQAAATTEPTVVGGYGTFSALPSSDTGNYPASPASETSTGMAGIPPSSASGPGSSPVEAAPPSLAPGSSGGQPSATSSGLGGFPSTATPKGSSNGSRTVSAASVSAPDGLGGVFYLILVLAAGATLATGQLMRFLGVRWARSSD